MNWLAAVGSPGLTHTLSWVSAGIGTALLGGPPSGRKVFSNSRSYGGVAAASAAEFFAADCADCTMRLCRPRQNESTKRFELGYTSGTPGSPLMFLSTAKVWFPFAEA